MKRSIESRIISIDEEVRPEARVVVIDVVRAFSCTALALARGTGVIACVESMDDAWAANRRWPAKLLMGEERGMKPEGFDLGNSPVEVRQAPQGLFKHGHGAIQRTSNGTRGLLKASRSSGGLWAASALNVGATIAELRDDMEERRVDIMITDPSTGEDLACAQHIQEGLLGHSPDSSKLREAVLRSEGEHRALWRRPRGKEELELFQADIEVCADVNGCNIPIIGRLDKSTGHVEVNEQQSWLNSFG